MKKRNLKMGLIGNCVIGALVDQYAEIVWTCLPRFDGDPVFCSLLKTDDEDAVQGTYAIDLEDFSHSEQHYEKNTAILITTLYDTHGNGVVVTDFVPRFTQYGRMFRPMMLNRKLAPIGSPKIRIRLRPAYSDGQYPYSRIQGSNHIRFVGNDLALRLTTGLSVTAVMDETWFVLDGEHYLILGDDKSIKEPIKEISERFYAETESYWLEWSRYLAIPFEWQGAVIRAAITLKLSAYEDTGAIIAAMTTSLPEAKDTQRNWDYRFCWLRDSFFTVHALNRLGTTRTMEQYLQYLVNIVAEMDEDHLQPVFCINGSKSMPERIAHDLPGYRGMGPVRVGNQAAEQIQHDVYGAIVLSATQMFFDERIRRPGSVQLFELLETVGDKAYAFYDKPDAGLWELRGSKHVHTFSSMMCWAAADRLAKIARKLELPERVEYWQCASHKISTAIEANGFNNELNAYTATWGGDTMDASLLLACELGYIDGKDPRFIGTITEIENKLIPEGSKYLFRYVVEDDFGTPENAFTICSFWYIDALAAAGREQEARVLFEDLLSKRNHLGLMSEDLDPETGELWGNFPQTYSMVGIINSARILSKKWEHEL
ncbi:glycoside hydrolase family 15 protein [Gilvimarinus agarilyticus]|uniref:glycoside hydrolase family 15 protein n=1 Tax=unclassified Gilvimarinus TaxID=2642066 RepID=UPI001C08636D|nr:MULTISPECIES: glycoside hydrolase family 15 protein [unclassified Gilvimarinus]MBU2885366.1 glycoside hydrolase family 15 protein [Gilvimarinus agarilyticus]MDO6570265.1 glycoside hydrolase family 15 protein [Gilvimarinus sp. 2_MG-2023]MDO6746947.1 glycoside hydrolase family 15 protein [Gilvimarinus sp. 1_MG-2023]